jgi:hypothetical protein
MSSTNLSVLSFTMIVKADLVVLIAEEVTGNPPGSWRFLDMMKSLLNLFDGFRLGWLI